MNDKKNVNVKCPQTMSCIFKNINAILFCNLKFQATKYIVVYIFVVYIYTKNGITTLKKRSECKAFYYWKNVQGRSKQSIKRKSGKKLAKKNQIHSIVHLSTFLLPKIFSKRIICNKLFF